MADPGSGKTINGPRVFRPMPKPRGRCFTAPRMGPEFERAACWCVNNPSAAWLPASTRNTVNMATTAMPGSRDWRCTPFHASGGCAGAPPPQLGASPAGLFPRRWEAAGLDADARACWCDAAARPTRWRPQNSLQPRRMRFTRQIRHVPAVSRCGPMTAGASAQLGCHGALSAPASPTSPKGAWSWFSGATTNGIFC